MRPTVSTIALSAVFAAATAGSAFAEERELGSHEHGHATLQIAVEGDAVEMMLEIPGESVVGFERAPSTDEERASVAAATEQLGDPLTLFTLPEAASCTVSSAEVELHQEGNHNAFEGEYMLQCADVNALQTVETRLFELYPAIDEIEVEYATPAGQGATELEVDAAAITLPAAS